MGKGDDIRNRELLSQGGHRAPRGQEQIAVAALSGLGLADIDEHAEEPSLEAFIQAVLNSNIEALDVAEPLEAFCSWCVPRETSTTATGVYPERNSNKERK
jgi:hypothetical protein